MYTTTPMPLDPAHMLAARASDDSRRRGPSTHIIIILVVLALFVLGSVARYRKYLRDLYQHPGSSRRGWEGTNHVGDVFGEDVEGRRSMASVARVKPVLWEVRMAEPLRSVALDKMTAIGTQYAPDDHTSSAIINAYTIVLTPQPCTQAIISPDKPIPPFYVGVLRGMAPGVDAAYLASMVANGKTSEDDDHDSLW